MKKLLFLCTLACASICHGQNNEIYFADPTVFVENGTYYMTGTRNIEPLGFALLESKDLKHWKSVETKHSNLILKCGHRVFVERGFWAPQILKEGGRYYLAYTANEQTALASSDRIAGPYTQRKVAPIDGSEKNIDPFLFKDDDGKYYLYHVRFDKGNYIWVAEFDLEKGQIVPGTLKKCFDCTQEWESTPNYKSNPIMEGPTVIKKDGLYYMFYSANHFKNIDYAVGYAVAASPRGPWKKADNNPIIHRDLIGENGTGHGDFFEGLDGNLYYVFHVHNSNTEIQPRRTRIVSLNFQYDRQKEVYRITADKNKIITPTCE